MNDNQKSFISGGIIAVCLSAIISSTFKAIKDAVKFFKSL